MFSETEMSRADTTIPQKASVAPSLKLRKAAAVLRVERTPQTSSRLLHFFLLYVVASFQLVSAAHAASRPPPETNDAPKPAVTPPALDVSKVAADSPPSAAPQTASAASNAPVATVNGVAIPKEQLEMLVSSLSARQGQPDTPELRNLIRDRFISLELLSQEATKKGLDKKKEAMLLMEMSHRDILAQQLIYSYLKENPVKPEEIKEEYEKEIKNVGKQYHAHHILLEKEDEAKKVIEELKKGAKFEDLAKKSSKDPGSSSSGGDLGWNVPTAFVPKFSAALLALKEGTFTQAPLQTEFGYHVIRLDGVRKTPTPPFDDRMQGQLRQRLEQRKIQKLEASLRAKSKIE